MAAGSVLPESTHGTANRQPTIENGPKWWCWCVVDNSHRAAAANRRHSELTGQQSIPRLAQQGSRQQQATDGHARSTRSDQTSPNARGGPAQRTHDDTAALLDGRVAAWGQPAPSQAKHFTMQQQYWQQPNMQNSMMQALQYPTAPYSYASSDRVGSPDYGYADPAQQQVRRNAHLSWHAAGAHSMASTWPAFRLAAGMIA